MSNIVEFPPKPSSLSDLAQQAHQERLSQPCASLEDWLLRIGEDVSEEALAELTITDPPYKAILMIGILKCMGSTPQAQKDAYAALGEDFYQMVMNHLHKLRGRHE